MKMKKLILLVISFKLLALNLMKIPMVFAEATTLSSPTFKLEAISLGTDVVAVSSEASIPPKIIDGPTVTITTANSATITWKTDKNSSSIVRFGTAIDYGQEQGKAIELTKEHTVTIVGLTPETPYHYSIRSIDASANKTDSTDATFTSAKAAGISSVQVTDITFTSATVQFTTDSAANAEIQYGISSDYGTVKGEDPGSFSTSHTIKLADLKTGTSYHLRVKATDRDGKLTYSDDYIFSTLPLPTLSNLRAANIKPNSVDILWETNVEADSLVEYYPKNQPDERKTAGKTDRVTTHIVHLDILLSDVTYVYKALSLDKFSNRAESSLQEFTTTHRTEPPIITDLKVEIIATSRRADTTSAIVTWKTDELANSQIIYGLGITPGLNDTIGPIDPTLTIDHFQIIQDLRPGTSYHVAVHSVDPTGNQGQSDVLTFLTPKPKRSLLQLIIAKLEETFGFLTKVFRWKTLVKLESKN